MWFQLILNVCSAFVLWAELRIALINMFMNVNEQAHSETFSAVFTGVQSTSISHLGTQVCKVLSAKYFKLRMGIIQYFPLECCNVILLIFYAPFRDEWPYLCGFFWCFTWFQQSLLINWSPLCPGHVFDGNRRGNRHAVLWFWIIKQFDGLIKVTPLDLVEHLRLLNLCTLQAA